MDDSPSPRRVYTPSGRFDAADLAVLAIAFVGAALTLAAGLAYALRSGNYLVGWGTLFIGALLVVGVMRVVSSAKCRNRGVACVLGLLVGLLMLAGFYHIDQCSRWAVGWERIEKLPGYIAFRMETDDWHFLGDGPEGRLFAFVLPQPTQAGRNPWLAGPNGWNWHWCFFLLEIGAFVVLPAASGWVRAGRPFSERFDDWFASDMVRVTPDSATALRQALADGSLAEWVINGVEKSQDPESQAEVTAWYCPRPSSEHAAESEVYLMIDSDRAVLIEPEEAAALTGLLPGLEALAIPESTKFKPAATAEGPVTKAAATTQVWSTSDSVATLTSISGPYVDKGLGNYQVVLGLVLSIGAMLAPIPVVLLFVASVNVLHDAVKMLARWELIVGGYVAVVGFSLYFAVLRWYNAEDPVWFRVLLWYRRRVITQQAAQRTDALFPPEHPETIYAEVVPRRAWGDPSRGRKESENGLLLIEQERGLLFEGDRNRYIVPLPAIISCDVEEVTRMGNTSGLFGIIVVVRIAEGIHELPIVPLTGIDGANPCEKATALQAMILALLGSPGYEETDG
ncbi:MAG: hypothetical protein C0467_02760 [Planctomycetaceae bacterium]|nr:hypothetical protein [Planctomycetaceae bacterium]